MKIFSKKYGKALITMTTLAGGTLLLTLTKSLDFPQVWNAIKQVGLLFFALALGLSLLQITLQASRLWALIPSPLRVSWPKVAKTFVYGQFVNTFTPARAGEVAKVVWLQKGESLTLAHSTGVILADKIVDFTALLILIIGVGLPISLLTLPQLGEHPLLVGILTSLGLVTLLGLILWKRPLRQWASHLFVGMSSMLKPWPIITALVLALGVWITEALVIGLLAESQGTVLSAAQVLWVLVVLNLSIAIPISFANLGVFEAAMVFGLTQVSVPLDAALAIAIVHHSAQLLSLFVALVGVRLFRHSDTPVNLCCKL